MNSPLPFLNISSFWKWTIRQVDRPYLRLHK
jgi:hypothetical protein